MSIALDGSLVLYTLKTLKSKGDSSSNKSISDASNAVRSALDLLEDICSEATSITNLTAAAQRPPIHSLYVTSIEWRHAPSSRMYHEYIVLHVSLDSRSPPSAAIRIDRYGKLGVRERWWHLQPFSLAPNTIRTATSVIAGPIGDQTADPSSGGSIVKYTFWAHSVPTGVNMSHLRLLLENSRRDACNALNQNIRPWVPNGLYLTNAKRGRRWADARGLEPIHSDIAQALSEAMETGIIRCLAQSFLTWRLPSWAVWSSTVRSVTLRREYAQVVDAYRTALRRIVDSLPDLDSESRSRMKVAWGADEVPRSSHLIVRMLDKSLPKHAFICPGSPIATLSDVASRIETLAPILPQSGITSGMCRLYARTLTARFPDDLWHGYATPVPPMPVGVGLATWRRARNSELFWALFDGFLQLFVFLVLIPVEGITGIWVVSVPLIHAWVILPWMSKKKKFWRRIWNVYDGNPVQGEGETRDNDSNSFLLQSTKVPNES